MIECKTTETLRQALEYIENINRREYFVEVRLTLHGYFITATAMSEYQGRPKVISRIVSFEQVALHQGDNILIAHLKVALEHLKKEPDPKVWP